MTFRDFCEMEIKGIKSPLNIPKGGPGKMNPFSAVTPSRPVIQPFHPMQSRQPQRKSTVAGK